jgi:hypothetical protein
MKLAAQVIMCTLPSSNKPVKLVAKLEGAETNNCELPAVVRF